MSYILVLKSDHVLDRRSVTLSPQASQGCRVVQPSWSNGLSIFRRLSERAIPI